MGNCCSSKRANGYDPESDTDAQKILEEITHSVTGGGHGHHQHANNKRHSAGNTAELKPLTAENNVNGKRNSLKSKNNIEEEREDLISASVQQQLSSQDSFDSTTSGPHSFPQQKSHTHTHTRQVSTEKVGSFGPQFKTPISSIPHHMRMEGFQRAKHNSTSSLYIKSTLSTPDNDEILKCMANALLYHIERGTNTPQKVIEIFSEEKYPISKGKLELKTIPTVDTIYKFIRDIFKAERLDSECAIMCLAYVERIITFTGVTLNPTNWRRIILSALILASKVWEDQSVWNVDFLPVFDNLTATDLNNLERQFLALLQYNVSLTASVYAKYYFELRTFSKLDSTHFPLKPLDKAGVKRLEDHSKASEYRVKTFKRSASVDQINPPEPHTRADPNVYNISLNFTSLPLKVCQEAAGYAKNFASCGCPYVFGADDCSCGSGGMDCSGLVYRSYHLAGWTGIHRVAKDQYTQGTPCGSSSTSSSSTSTISSGTSGTGSSGSSSGSGSGSGSGSSSGYSGSGVELGNNIRGGVCTPWETSGCNTGDILFFCFDDGRPCPNHELMALGNGVFAECPHKGLDCRVITVIPYHQDDFYGCKSICS
eukprot:gene2506-3102_t